MKSNLDAILSDYGTGGLYTHASVIAGTLGSGISLRASWSEQDTRQVYDLASLTKALVTTPLIFDSGVDLDGPLEQLMKSEDFPPWIRQISIDKLLRHQSGLPAWRNFYVNRLSPESRPLAMSDRHLLVQAVIERSVNPIKSHHAYPSLYSDVGFILLGIALEHYYGKNLSVLFTELKKKLGSKNGLEFGPAREAISTGWCACRERELIGEVWDENCAALGGVAGHCGLFGSAEDIAVWLETLASNAVGADLIARNRAAVRPGGEALVGWRQGGDRSSEVFGNGLGIGHLGFTGTAFWLDQSDRYAILLTNRVISGRINRNIVNLRREVFGFIDKI